MRKITITGVLTVAALAIVGCDADPMTEDPPEVVQEVTETEDTADSEEETEAAEPEETEEEAAEAAEGTRDNPLPLGTRAIVGDYDLTVTDVVLDADELVLDANEFNEPSEVGQYVLVTVEGEFLGGEMPEGNPGIDLSAVIVGSDARQYADFDTFAVPPDALMDSPTLEAGGTFSGNFVLSVPTDVLDGALLFIEPLMSFDNDSRAFWALP